MPASLGLVGTLLSPFYDQPNSVLYDDFDSLFEVSPRRDLEGTGEASKDKQELLEREVRVSLHGYGLQGAKRRLSVRGWAMVGDHDEEVIPVNPYRVNSEPVGWLGEAR